MAGPPRRLEDPCIAPIASELPIASWFAVSILAAALGFGCGDSSSSSDPSMTQEPGAVADQQVSFGQDLFMRHCAHCHGGSGEGGDAPRLVGLERGALPLEPPEGAVLRTGEFRTAADIAAFVEANMPLEAPGSLSPDEYYALVAFLLDANGVPAGRVLDADTAAALELER